jgi:hypothetical protein
MKVVKCRIPPHEPDQPIVGPKEALEDIAAVREFLQREARSTNEKAQEEALPEQASRCEASANVKYYTISNKILP